MNCHYTNNSVPLMIWTQQNSIQSNELNLK
ncbi:unnamed protein product, partial [Adineta steineri]